MDASETCFGFGIEAEYLIVDEQSKPLFHDDFNFEDFRDFIDAIPVSDFSKDGLNVKPLHRSASPYLVEGYYLTDSDMKPLQMLVKGLEVRTPLVSTIDAAVMNLSLLTERAQTYFGNRYQQQLCAISHHPTESNFYAAPNYKRHDYWQWALTAMTTFGPDVNISVPADLVDEIDQVALNERINFYMPAVIALTFSSPLFESQLWESEGVVGKSIRTFKRSEWAPLYYIHTEPTLRFEFKGFEMPQDLADYHAFFLIGLSLLLDNQLVEKRTDAERLTVLKELAIYGIAGRLDTNIYRQQAADLLESAERTAVRFGFNYSCLQPLWARLEELTCPSDLIIQHFNESHSIEKTMEFLKVKTLQSAIGAKSLTAPALALV
ncbi:MAG: hypothetical protein IAF58_14050 [Leptolyngbya sp.]|nr:hypothetical protein [Candidatus Melainabacteria bacterium]